MRVWKGFVGLAVLMMACSGVVWGDDTNSNSMGSGNDQVPPADQVEAPPAEAPAETPAVTPGPTTTYGPFMQALEQLGIGKTMEDWGFNIHGYVEGGYLYDTTVPTDQTPAKSAPGDDIFFAGPYKNALMLNQADLTIERDMVNLPKGDWDFGFVIETGYGRDDFFTHSDGILDQHNKQAILPGNDGAGTGNDDQLDLLQANVSLGIPIGTGLTVSAGKFLTYLGYEKIDPTQNMFYTHSYGFSYGKPFTMTGVLASYNITDPSSADYVTLSGGVSRGWNQSTYDNNGDIDGVMQFKVHGEGFDWITNMMIGPEGVLPYGPADYAHWWWVPETIVDFKIGDQLTVAVDLLYGDAPALSQWFSAASYFQYRFDPHVALGTRLEYYHDGRGVTTGVGGTDINYFEVTLGATINPLPDSPYLGTFAIRPEARYDDADQPAFDFSHRDQFTVAVDLMYRF
jgi:hypothetical protein